MININEIRALTVESINIISKDKDRAAIKHISNLENLIRAAALKGLTFCYYTCKEGQNEVMIYFNNLGFRTQYLDVSEVIKVSW